MNTNKDEGSTLCLHSRLPPWARVKSWTVPHLRVAYNQWVEKIGKVFKPFNSLQSYPV